MKIPALTLSCSPRLTLTAEGVRCENHGGLKKYSGECVEIITRDGFVRVTGDGLQLAYMNSTELALRGFITAVEML